MKRSILFLVIFFLIKNTNAQFTNPAVVKNEMERPLIAASSNIYNGFIEPRRTDTIKMSKKKDKKSENHFIKKLFIKFYVGNGFFTPGSYSVSSLNSIAWTKPDGNGHDTTIKTQAKRGIGGGFRFGIGIGLIQNDFLNIALDAEYQHGGRLKSSLNTLIDNTNYATANDEMNYTTITLTPHVIFKALARTKFYIYNKLGILLTLPFTLSTSGNSDKSSVTRWPHSSVWTQTDFYRDALFSITDKSNSTYDTKYEMSLGIGLNVAFGINYRINNNLRAFGEIFGNYSALTPHSSLSDTYGKQLTLIEIDTTNFHLENPYKSVNYNHSYTTYTKDGAVGISSSQNQDLGPDSEGYTQNKASVTATGHKYTINMAVLGINVGIIYRF